MRNLVFMSGYIFFKTIGFIPAKLQNLNIKNDSSLSFVHSWRGTIYNAGLILSFSVLSFFSIRSIYQSEYPNKSATTEAIEFVKAICGTIITLILWTWICVHQSETIKVANEFFEIDSAMIKYKHIYCPEMGTFKFVLFSLLNSFVWIVMMWTDYLGFDKVPVITFISAVGPNVAFSWFLFMYSFNILALKIKFQAVNAGILKLSTLSIASISNSSENVTDKFIIRNFLALKYTHTRLHGVINEMAKFYSFPILLIITELCVSIVYTSYYLVGPLVLPSVELTWLIFLNSACYLSMEVFPIATMVITIGQIMRELGRTADACHKLLARSHLSRGVNAELKLFSLELLHQNVQFTACGIFNLDGTLLHSICGMTATYLIILIQFQSGGHNSEK